MSIVCPYCGKQAKKVTGDKVYPVSPHLHKLVFYRCNPCDAHVGVHKGTDQPLGRLANKELRLLKMQAHQAFDPIWKNGSKSRTKAYLWLAANLSIPSKQCHIGMFDEELCRKTIAICLAENNDFVNYVA